MNINLFIIIYNFCLYIKNIKNNHRIIILIFFFFYQIFANPEDTKFDSKSKVKYDDIDIERIRR